MTGVVGAAAVSPLVRRALSRPELVALALVYLAFRGRFLRFVPMWDGAVYYHFTRYISFRNLDPLQAEVHNHVSPLFIYLMHVPAVLAPGDVRGLNAALALVGLASVLAFHGLVTWATAGRLSRAEAILLTALFAFHPTILANTINLSLDIGVLTFFLLHTLHVVRDRFALAALWGVCLVFTKETGMLLLPLSVASLLLVDPGRRRTAWLIRVAPAVLVPAGLYVAYLLYKTLVRGRPIFWEGLGSGPALALKLLDPFQVDGYLVTQLLQLFVLQFHWVLTALGLGLAVGYLRRRRRTATAHAERLRAYSVAHGWPVAHPVLVDVVHQRLTFTAILFAAVLYLLTRFRPYSNARYLLPLFALFLLLLGQLLAVGVRGRGLRTAVMGAVLLGLFGPSLEATVDPLSRRLFGTFDFGRHPMLRMTAFTGECCDAGRDQLVYNLQFTRFHDLQNRVYQDVRPTPRTVILAAWAANFGQFWPLSEDDYTRSVPSSRTFSPRYGSVEDSSALIAGSDEVYFVAFPNVDNRGALEVLGKAFAERKLTRYEWRGYGLDVYRFSNAAGPPTPGQPGPRNSGDGGESGGSARGSRPPPR
jgi:hypothetical protein